MGISLEHWALADSQWDHYSSTDPQALTAWTLSDSMVNGNIKLCLLHNICNLVGDTSAQTWTNLATAFGAIGVSKLFVDFLGYGSVPP